MSGEAAIEGSRPILEEFERLIATGEVAADIQGELRTGVDLGTANIVLAVVDETGKPVAGATYPSTVVRDGIVVDYMGATRAVSQMKAQLEDRLRRKLEAGAAAIPPGVIEGSVKVIGNVLQASDFRVTNIVDEPTAAATVLGIKDGAVVDVGGGTTGISILRDGQVIYTWDEATGGTHMTLVLAGFYGWSTEKAEVVKRDPNQEAEVYPVVRPVVEKMAAIVQKCLAQYPVENVYVVGGACSFSQFVTTFENYLGVAVAKPAAPLLVTPLGIALNCKE